MVDFFFASSNAVKHKEYQEYGLPYPAKATNDIKEPMTDLYGVAVYKSQQSGPGAIVEDTALEVEGVDMGVEVRFLEHTLDNYVGHKAVFQVALGQNDGKNVKVFYGETSGTIVKNKFPDAYGFDGNFIPDGETETLYELDKKGEKMRVSPRRKAVVELLNNNHVLIADASPVEWSGRWQNEEVEEPEFKI